MLILSCGPVKSSISCLPSVFPRQRWPTPSVHCALLSSDFVCLFCDAKLGFPRISSTFCLSLLPFSLFSSQPLEDPLSRPTVHHASVPILHGDRRLTSLWLAYIARAHLKTLKEQEKKCVVRRFHSLCTINQSISFCATKSLQFSSTLRSQHACSL